MLAPGRIVTRNHRAFTARGRDLVVRRFRPTGAAWWICAFCKRGHAAPACAVLARELANLLKGDSRWV